MIKRSIMCKSIYLIDIIIYKYLNQSSYIYNESFARVSETRKNWVYTHPTRPSAVVASASVVLLVGIPPIAVSGVVVGPRLSARLIGSAEFLARPRTALLLRNTSTAVADRQRLLFPIAGFSSVPGRLLLVRRKQQLNLVDRRRRRVVQFHGQWLVGVVQFFRHGFDRHSLLYDSIIRGCDMCTVIPIESFVRPNGCRSYLLQTGRTLTRRN